MMRLLCPKAVKRRIFVSRDRVFPHRDTAITSGFNRFFCMASPSPGVILVVVISGKWAFLIDEGQRKTTFVHVRPGRLYGYFHLSKGKQVSIMGEIVRTSRLVQYI